MPATTVETLIYKLEAQDKASKTFDSVSSKISASQATLGTLDKAFKTITKTMATFSIGAVRNFAQYEDTLSHARRTMRLTRQETLDLGNALMDLSTDFSEGGLAAGVTANELSKIAGQLGQLGFSARDNIEGFNELVATVAKVSVAFGISSAKAAENLGILQNLYNFSQDEFSNVASSIAYLGNTTVASAAQILDIMTRVGSMAGLLGVSAQDMAAISASLREAGVSAQVGGTAMSQIFSRLASDVDKFGEVLGAGGLSGDLLRMKIETGDATGALKDVLQAIQFINATEGKIAAIQALKDLGLQGVRVQQTLLALSNNIGGLNANLAASQQAYQENTAVQDAYQAAIDNTQQKMTQFKNLLDIIQKIVGEDLAMAFSDFLDNHLIPFTQGILDWLKTSESAEAIFGRDGLIASGLDWIGQKLTENQEAFLGWLGNLDTWIPETVDALKQTFKVFFDDLDFGMNDVLTIVEKFGKAISDVDGFIMGIKETWNIFIDTIKGSMQTLENIGKPLESIFYSAMESANAVTSTINNLADSILNLIPGMNKVAEVAYEQSLFPDMTAWAEKTGSAVKWIGDNLADVGSTMAGTQTALAGLGRFQDMSAAQLSQLKSGGVLGPSGLLAVDTAQRVNAGKQFRTDIAARQEALQTQAKQKLEIVLQMGDVEVGRMNTVLDDNKRQQQRRSFGRSTV